MRKLFIIMIGMSIMPLFLNAKYISRGAVMCNSLSAITELKNAIDTPSFWNVWGKMTATSRCAEVEVGMKESSVLVFEDLGSGITRIKNIYVFTREVKN